MDNFLSLFIFGSHSDCPELFLDLYHIVALVHANELTFTEVLVSGNLYVLTMNLWPGRLFRPPIDYEFLKWCAVSFLLKFYYFIKVC